MNGIKVFCYVYVVTLSLRKNYFPAMQTHIRTYRRQVYHITDQILRFSFHKHAKAHARSRANLVEISGYCSM